MLIYKEFEGLLATYKVGMNFSSQRFEVEEITIERLASDASLNGTALRKITIESVLREAFRIYPISIDEIAELPEAKRLLGRDDYLGVVALHYSIAWILNTEPAKAVEEITGMPSRTVSYWISKAKDASHIDFALSFLVPYLDRYFSLAVVRIVDTAVEVPA